MSASTAESPSTARRRSRIDRLQRRQHVLGLEPGILRERVLLARSRSCPSRRALSAYALLRSSASRVTRDEAALPVAGAAHRRDHRAARAAAGTLHPLDPAHRVGGRGPGTERLVELRVVRPARHAEPQLHLGRRSADGEREQHPEPDSTSDPHAAVSPGVRGETTSQPATAIAIPAALDEQRRRPACRLIDQRRTAGRRQRRGPVNA